MLDQGVLSRINSSLNFKEPDRVPVCDFIDNPRVFSYFCSDENPVLKDKVKAYHQLGIDICWRFERRVTQRHEGFLEKLQRFALRKPRLGLIEKDSLTAEFNEYESQQKVFHPYTYLAMMSEGCLSVAYNSLGFEEFCKKMYVELIEIEKLIDICAENLRQKADYFASRDLGPVFFVRDDIAFGEKLLFSKAFLDQHWVPRINQAIEALKRKQIKVILHSQGNITDYLDGVVSAGFDGIHPVDPRSGMDINMIRNRYARSLILFGNVDLISAGSAEKKDIVARTKKCIHSLSGNGGHFIGSAHGINKQVKLQDALSFFANIREFGNFSAM